jgi:hypothetical protein
MLWAAWRCLRRMREGSPWDVLAITALTFVLGYFAFGLFADDTRFRLHWPLPGYLPLLVALPALLAALPRRRWLRAVLATTFALAAAGQLAVLAYVGAAASGRGAMLLHGLKAFPDNFVGWRQSAAEARHWLARMPSGSVLVADNFMLAAELDFQLDGRDRVYVLDSPLNVRHGRAPQLAIWRLDEAGLRAAHTGAPVLLAVEETALRERQRPPWLGSVCARVADPRFLGRLDLYGGERRFAFYAATVPAAPLPALSRDRCVVWQQAHASYLQQLRADP